MDRQRIPSKQGGGIGSSHRSGQYNIATGVSRGQLFETVKTLYDLDSIPEHITVGSKSKTKLRELYSKSRFVVVPLLPTDTDNGLTTILEAMAMGKAVICSEVEGQIDVIQDGVTGIYVPQGEPMALREAMQDLWDKPEKAERIGKAARLYIEQNHTMDQFVKNIKQEVVDAVDKTRFQQHNQTTTQERYNSK